MAIDINWDGIDSMVDTGDTVDSKLTDTFGKIETALNDTDDRSTVNESNIAVLTQRTDGIDIGVTEPTSDNPSKRTAHSSIAHPLLLESSQDLSLYTPEEVREMTEFITVANAFSIEDALKEYSDTTFMPLPTNGIMELDGDNPAFKMGVEAGGLTAQMQVIDKETSKEVITMEWLKTTQSFLFALMDRDTGVIKNSFRMDQDGKAYINSKEIATVSEEMTYDYEKVSGQTINQDTYVQVVKLTTPVRKAGVYEYRMALSFKYSSTSRSAVFRFSVDNGTNWTEFKKEPKDATDIYPVLYGFPKVVASDQPINIILEAKCESSSDTLTVLYADLVAERKK